MGVRLSNVPLCVSCVSLGYENGVCPVGGGVVVLHLRESFVHYDRSVLIGHGALDEGFRGGS